MTDGSSTAAVLALVGALGGVLLTGAMSIGTAALNQHWSERSRSRAADDAGVRARRDELRAACHAYLVAANRFFQALEEVSRMTRRGEQFDPTERTRPAVIALQDAYLYLTISAGAQVRELAQAYNASQFKDLEPVAYSGDRAAWDEQAKAVNRRRDELRAAMRADLGVED
ncbi:hypothetical protein ABT369_37515 [Dactylosporangium sp. NPDC000244]|uniref:hypothetical protein n=1 Tax=Dactylosporangium sp. NPDC000244 TaxID=3154365 RepID=UPI00331871BF